MLMDRRFLSPDPLGADPALSLPQVCDLEQITSSLSASCFLLHMRIIILLTSSSVVKNN